MNYRMSGTASAALAAFLMTAQVGFAEEDAAVSNEEPEVICFNADRIRNFDGLSDKFLYIEVKTTERYLMTMQHQCFGLKSAQIFAFKDTLRRICSNDNFTDIVVNDTGQTTCRIDTFERVESKEVAKAIVAEREQAKAAE